MHELDIDEFKAAEQGEPELQKFCQAQRAGLLGADAAGVVKEMSSILPEVDARALLDNEAMGADIAASFQEALKVSVDGWVDDDLEFIEPWGFELSDIKVPVLLYQGSEDKMVPFAHGQWFAKHLPQEKLRKYLIEGQGHISIFIGREDSMIDELLAIAKPSS